MKSVYKPKIVLLVVLFLFTFFFSSDFGLIDVEKTSIITAIAVDKSEDEYMITAQVAVPEANDTNTENEKAQISATGSTIGGAIKELGDITGWFPKLAFCNLIILGNDFVYEDVANVLDFFAKTLRVQDSALVCMSHGKAKDILSIATPLDNISSFALQKILFKNPGYDKAICSIDIKSFFEGHYSPSSSAYMPLIHIVPTNPADKKSGSDDSESSGQKEKDNGFFDARTTALFYNGMKVGELNQNETLVFNGFTSSFVGTTIPIDNVTINDKTANYLLSVLTNKSKIKVLADEENFLVKLNMSIYCKVIDVNTDGSQDALAQNIPIPEPVKSKAEKLLTSYIYDMVKKSVDTGCDFMNLKQKLYRFNHKQYSRYENNFFDKLSTEINVSVHGQR